MREKDKDVPARMRFPDDDQHTDQPSAGNASLNNEFNLDEDILLENESSHDQKKSRGLPSWLMGLIAFLLLIVLGGGGLVIYKIIEAKNAQKGQVEFNEVRPTQPIPQPVIGIPTTPGMAPMVGGDMSASGVQSSQISAPLLPAATNGLQQAIQPMASGRLEASEPPAVALGILPATTNVTVASQPAPSVSLSVDERAALIQAKDKSEKDVATSKKEISNLQARVQSLEEQVTKLAHLKIASESPPHQTKVITVSKSSMPNKLSPALDVTSVKQAYNNPVARDIPSYPKNANTVPMVGGYVTGVIGNRAFIAVKNEDGQEVEKSVSPGDTYAGHKVVEVDGKKREVVLDNGSIISTRK